MQGRAGLGNAEQWRHVPLPGPEDDAQGPGLPGLDRVPATGWSGEGEAADREHLLARHERGLERQAVHAALYELEIEDLQRRRLGTGRARSAWLRNGEALCGGGTGIGI